MAENLIFQKKLSVYNQRPEDGSRFIVRKNLKEIIKIVLDDINNFNSSNCFKYKSLCQLENIIVLAEHSIIPHYETILRTFIKFFFYEEKEITLKIKNIVEIIGFFVEPNISIPILKQIIEELDTSAIKSLTSCLVMLSLVVKNQDEPKMETHLETIIKIIMQAEQNFSDNSEIIEAIYQLCDAIIHLFNENLAIYVRSLFTVLLTIQASPNLSSELKAKAVKTTETLANKCGYTNINDLHANEVSILFDEIIEKKSYVNWNKYSKDRFKFEVIVRNCGKGIAKFMEVALEIMTHLANPQNDVEIKMDTLILLEHLIDQKDLHDTLKSHSVRILQNILIQSAVWRIGKPNIKIRKGGVICMIKLIDQEIIAPEELHKSLKVLAPVLKSCLNDDWGPDLRCLTCTLLEKVLFVLNEIIDEEELRDIYPAFLERLDDSQDMIRMEIAKSITAFFACKKLRLSPSIMEYVVKQIFVHLDDQNESIQMAIYNTIKFAARVAPEIVLSEGMASLKKQKYPRKCQELIRFSEELVAEKKESSKGMEEELKEPD